MTLHKSVDSSSAVCFFIIIISDDSNFAVFWLAFLQLISYVGGISIEFQYFTKQEVKYVTLNWVGLVIQSPMPKLSSHNCVVFAAFHSVHINSLIVWIRTDCLITSPSFILNFAFRHHFSLATEAYTTCSTWSNVIVYLTLSIFSHNIIIIVIKSKFFFELSSSMHVRVWCVRCARVYVYTSGQLLY